MRSWWKGVGVTILQLTRLNSYTKCATNSFLMVLSSINNKEFLDFNAGDTRLKYSVKNGNNGDGF